MNISGEERDTVSLIGERETEERLVRRWKSKAKGRPMRWRILRDVVACLSLVWMTTEQIQVAMSRLWALKRNTTREILEELELGSAVVKERNDRTQLYMWGATQSGVDFWIGSTKAIPALTAQVASASAYANGSEGRKND